MEEKFLKLTDTVYKVLEYFPESDPLKNRAKDKALAIMDNLVLVNEVSGWASFNKEKIKVNILEDIDILMGYLWIGKTQKWLNSVNYLIIANEYEEIKKIVESTRLAIPVIQETQKLPEIKESVAIQIESPIETENPVNPALNNIGEQKETSVYISERQKAIIEFLNKNGKAQVMDLQTILPNITKRTIRRDLDELLALGKITRLGDFNQVSYEIKENQVLVN